MAATPAQNINPTPNPEIHFPTGTHLLVDFWNCKDIKDPSTLEDLFQKAALEASCELLKVAIHKFTPQGITGVAILSESHISFHSWPEWGYTSIDIFTCGEKSKPHLALEYLKKALSPERVSVTEEKRGGLENKKIWGQELSLDLYECNPETIRSKEKILQYTQELCILIDMKSYGKPFIERFAVHSKKAAGYSIAQMIETSLISGHFSEFWNRAYLNIFSCKPFDVEKAKRFSMEFFEAKDTRGKLNIR